MSPKTVLITGAAGFIGSHLSERCLALGWRVLGLDCFTEYYDEQLKRSNLTGAAAHPDFTLIEGSLLDLDLSSIVDEVSVVFHLAAQPGVRTSWDDFDLYTRLNVTSSHRLLDAVRDAPLERVVLASSSSVYGDAETLPTIEDVIPRPVSPYGVTKVAMEHLASVYWRTYRVPTVCLRYFTVFGPRQRPDMAFYRMIDCALEGRPFEVFGDGEQTRDFTYVGDAVDGTIGASRLGLPGGVYNIGGGSRRSMNSVFGTLNELTETHLELLYRERQPGDAKDTAADVDRARRELDFEPRMEFSRGLREQLNWQRALSVSPRLRV